MKTLHLSIILTAILVVIAIFALPELHLVQAVPYTSPEEQYLFSDIVMIGKVISATPYSPTYTKYEFQVEQYLKNPQPQDKITVFAAGTNKTQSGGRMPQTVFDVGERAFLYLKKQERNYVVWWFSHPTDSLCNPAPTQTDLNFEYPSTVGFGYDPLHITANNTQSIFSVNAPVIISYDTWNNHFTTKTFDVVINVKSNPDSKLIFNDTKQVELKPCIGHKTVVTSFVPKKIGRYDVEIIFDNQLLGTTFDIGNDTVPEFPFAIPILLLSIISLIVFYRLKFRIN